MLHYFYKVFYTKVASHIIFSIAYNFYQSWILWKTCTPDRYSSGIQPKPGVLVDEIHQTLDNSVLVGSQLVLVQTVERVTNELEEVERQGNGSRTVQKSVLVEEFGDGVSGLLEVDGERHDFLGDERSKNSKPRKRTADSIFAQNYSEFQSLCYLALLSPIRLVRE